MISQRRAKVITHPLGMQREASALRKAGKTLAFVPTMGALHAGHLTLIRKARKLADVVVVSIYVNPTQFGPKEDFTKYPKPFRRDVILAGEAGADVIFSPKNLYEPDASTFVEEVSLSQGRCGTFRPGHFRGVTTVVAKLLNIVQPHIAVFGQKDAQQCDVLERMVRDLFMPVKIFRVETVREASGLALSSRNSYLSVEELATARQYAAALKTAVGRKGLSPAQLEAQTRKLLLAVPGVKVQYVTMVNDRLCAAVFVGKTRLIDNLPCVVKGGRIGK